MVPGGWCCSAEPGEEPRTLRVTGMEPLAAAAPTSGLTPQETKSAFIGVALTALRFGGQQVNVMCRWCESSSIIYSNKCL